MEIQRISNNQPAFKGYLTKNFIKNVNNLVKSNIDECVKNANSEGIKVYENEIIDIANIGKKIIDRAKKYVAKTSKNTSLDYTDNYMSFINPLDKNHNVPVYNWDKERNGESRINCSCIILTYNKNELYEFTKNTRQYTLKALDLITKKLSNINPKDIDRVFLETESRELKSEALDALSFFDKFKARRHAKKIDKFASEIGEEQAAKKNVEKYLQKAKSENIIKERNIKIQKELEKNNRKIADKILNS